MSLGLPRTYTAQIMMKTKTHIYIYIYIHVLFLGNGAPWEQTTALKNDVHDFAYFSDTEHPERSRQPSKDFQELSMLVGNLG